MLLLYFVFPALPPKPLEPEIWHRVSQDKVKDLSAFCPMKARNLPFSLKTFLGHPSGSNGF
jgi:hypothetical protein